MCGRFVIAMPMSLLAEYFKTQNTLEGRDNFNIAPTADITVICQNNEIRKMYPMRWGLIPSWLKSESPGTGQINARAETLFQKPMFKNLVKTRRCLIPVSGFYEWKKGKIKQPFYFSRKDDLPLAFAGLWDSWTNPQGEVIKTCSIITTTANELMSPIHDRMPLILDNINMNFWLDEASNLASIELILELPSLDTLEVWPVSQAVNNPGFNSPDCIMPTDHVNF